jgi:RHH-type transcriptional regulator, proline utilization regulon repressor / proline dehydrogenase / delta 1-pyrroline-5-carboxylate dehydrogenase
VSFYEEFEAILFPDGEACGPISDLIRLSQQERLTQGFRREISIQGMPFLCALRPEENSLYLGTRRLARELSLLKLYEVQSSSLDEATEKHFFRLKEHVERISTFGPSNFRAEIEWVSFNHQLPRFWQESDWQDVNNHSQKILAQLVKKVGAYRSGPFEKVSDYGLTLTARYDLIRIHLLKFLALLPSLDHDRSGKEVKRNLVESLRRLRHDSDNLTKEKKRGSRPLPFYLYFLTGLGHKLAVILPPHLLASVVRYLVRQMARRFIAGENIVSSNRTIRELRASERQATLDQLGELVVSDREANEYLEKVLQLIHGLKQHIPKGEKNAAGIMNAHVSIKVSALAHDVRPHAFEAAYNMIAPRLRRILQEARREQVFVNVDAEHYHLRDLVLRIYRKVLLETPELRDYDQTGIVVQAYLRDGYQHLLEVVELARARGIRMPIRLVKGAYWDAETIEASAHQFFPPQFLNKEESDLHFRQLAYKALEHHQFIQLAVGSHNLQDHAFVEAVRELRFPLAPVIEHQCLHMTYEALSHGLARMGWPTRNYMPIGNLLVGMAYLVRRIMENSSQVGVLSIMRSHQKASGLMAPEKVFLERRDSGKIQHDSFITQLKGDFAPVRPLRTYLTEDLRPLEQELERFEQRVMGQQDSWAASTETKVFCSSRPELILGTIATHQRQDAEAAVLDIERALETGWWALPEKAIFRVAVLMKAADLMLLRRNQLSALIVYEAGKTLTEALADVDEAIDFLNFYARQEIHIQLAAEKCCNRGVFSVIAPWNFPLAIPCGMAVAPLVAGNGVVLKPAEQTPLIGIELHKLLIEAGVPAEIFKLILGDGEVVGAPLVTHARTAGVVFTGSKGVGQWIYRNAAPEVLPHYRLGMPMQKKIITEMGGKNAIIVTNNCELDETVSGILYAAFGHAGQKCSAASRIIVHREVKEALVTRLVQAVRDLKVGAAYDPATSVNPLISEHDQARVRKAVEEAKDEAIRSKGKIHIDRSFEKLPGYCVGPAVLELPLGQANRRDSWAQREIFGPVIHLIQYDSLIEAVELFNATEYALTGGIYSQSQDDIDFLLRFLRAGNLYVNRPNTGARVAIEPFGGFKLSGTGPKAGGPDYLSQFHFIPSPESVAPAQVTWATESGYELLVPRPSMISVSGRLKRFELFSNELLGQFELNIGTVNEKEKNNLTGFVNWILSGLESYMHEKHLNFVIPGQLSYNDKSLVREAGLFVAVSGRPSIKGIYYLLAALALGSGVSVVCVSEEAYRTWMGILNLAWKAGFSKTNIDITKASPQNLDKYLQQQHYSYVYAGQIFHYKDFLYPNILAGDSLNENMRSILSEVDGVGLADPAHVLDQFVWVRAVAVNTMRHGAPLEFSV